MLSAAAVLVCALELLYRSQANFPPVILLDTRPPDVTVTAEAFVRRNPDAVFLMTTTAVFRDARRGDGDALRKIASILVHEEWHLRHGPNERRAYEAQLTALMAMGLREGRPVFNEVRTTLLKVVAAEKKRARPVAITAAR
ncbi:MAG: hypothetical protein FJW14_10310 [Acidimicrobiia bacterium]|nr:hypothetical protein [Acidimicrobiia bacterium]